MRYSFATVVLAPRGGRAAPPDEAERARVFAWATKAGFEGVELNPRWHDVLSMSDSEVAALRREIADAGLCVSGLNLNRGILTRTSLAAQHRGEALRTVDVAALLGAEIVNLSLSMPTLATPERPPLQGADVPDEEHARAAEIVREIGLRAASAGVTVALDLHDDGLLDTAELCLRLLARVDLPNVGVNPDLGNICRGPGPVPNWHDAFIKLAPHALNWHVKNYRDFAPAPLWDGDIDYPAAFAVMRNAGYDGWVSIEQYQGDVFESQRQSLDYLRDLERSR